MNDWTPDRTGIEARKEWFPRDWGNLLDWPPLEGCQVIADGAVRAIASGGGIGGARELPELFPDIETLVARFRYASRDELFAPVSANPDIVWMSCGSQFSAPEFWRKPYSAIMDSARFHAIVSCSVFNMGYAGISLFEGKTRRRLALFQGGRVIERPAGV
jgi:hypothetical protein